MMRAIELSNGDQRVQAVEMASGVHFAICSAADEKWRLHGAESDVTIERFAARYLSDRAWRVVRIWGDFSSLVF
jgi:hypothetical protein